MQSAWEKKFIMGFSVSAGAVSVTEGGMRNITGGQWIPGVRGPEKESSGREQLRNSGFKMTLK